MPAATKIRPDAKIKKSIAHTNIFARIVTGEIMLKYLHNKGALAIHAHPDTAAARKIHNFIRPIERGMA
ncbi:MAG: hypothetical protein ABH825_01060, partial [Candidatus Omnitrophota bacterium]